MAYGVFQKKSRENPYYFTNINTILILISSILSQNNIQNIDTICKFENFYFYWVTGNRYIFTFLESFQKFEKTATFPEVARHRYISQQLISNFKGECDTRREESILVDTGLLLGLWFICEILVNT